VVKSHILAANAPFRIEIPERKNRQHSSKWSIPRLKREMSVGAKDKNPRRCKLQQINDGTPKDSSSMKQTINIVSKSSLNIDSIKEGLP